MEELNPFAKSLAGLSNFQPTQLNPKPLGGFTFQEGLGAGLNQDWLTPSVGLFSEDSAVTSSRPLSATSAQNSAQKGEAGSNALMDAWKSIQAMYEPTGGMPFAGSEDIRVKRDVYGRPYTTVRVSARDESGKFKERTEFDLSGKPVKTRGDITESTIKIDRSNEQPVSYSNPSQAAEIERRKQLAMSGQYGTQS